MMKYVLYKVQRGWMIVPNYSCVGWDSRIDEFVVFRNLREFAAWHGHKKGATATKLRSPHRTLPREVSNSNSTTGGCQGSGMNA